MCEVPIKTTLSSTNRPGIFSRIALALAAVGLISVSSAAVYTTPVQAATGINKSLNYQGRLLTASGAVVADGNYNMKFKIYQDGPGNVAGNTGGTLMWTELWQNSVATGSSSGVVVRNGYFSVNLGAYCVFAGGSCQGNTNTGVDFNQDTLWLSMDVAGTAISNTPTYDGEMLPMRRLSSTVYSLQADNANKLGGMTSAQFLQTVPGSSSVNVIAPTAASTVALTVKASTAGSTNSLEVFDSSNARQAFFDANGALNVAQSIQPTVTNTTDIGLTGTQFRTGYFGTSVITPTLDTNSAVALNIGTTNATGINLTKDTTVSAGQDLIMASGSGQFNQIFSGSSFSAHVITANSLAGANALKVTSTNNTAANTDWAGSKFLAYNLQGTTAVTGLISGLDLEFVQRTTVAGNNETAVNISVGAYNSTSTDTTVASLLNLANNDTATGNQIVVTDGIKINGANVTNGINFNGTFGTNLITASNFTVTQGGTVSAATSLQAPLFDTASAASLNIGSTNASSINLGKTGSNIATTITGTTTIKPSTGNDSATALQVQNAAGTSFFTADSTKNVINTHDINIGSAANNGSGKRLFSDGFESGGPWETWAYGGFSSGASAPSISTSTVRNGKYSTQINLTSAGGAGVSAGITPNSTVAARAYVNVTSQTNTADLISFSGFTAYRDQATGRLGFKNGVTSTSTVGSTVLTTGVWHKIELVVTINASTGTANLYLDDVNVLSQTGLNTGSTNPTTFTIGDTNSGRTALYYIDDVAVDTVRPGGSASLNVADTLHVGGSASLNGPVVVAPGSDSDFLFQVQNAGTQNLLTVNSNNGDVILGEAGANNVWLYFSNGTNGNQISLHAADGTAGYNLTLPTALGSSGDCLKDSNGSGVLAFGACVSSGANTSLSNLSSVNINTSLLTTSSTIDIGTSVNPFRTGYFSTTLQAGTSVLAPLYDTASAGALTVGNTNATSINIGKTGSNIATTITGTTVIKPSTGNDSASAFQVQNAAAESLFNINSTPDATNVVSNGSFETNTAGWTAMGGATISSTTTQAMFGSKSMDVTTTATANDGVKFPISLTAGVNYKITMYARLSSGGFSTMNFGYAADGSNETTYVSSANSMSTSGWQRFTLSFTPAAVSGSPYIFIKQTSSTARTFYIDGFYMAAGANDYGIYSQSKIALNGQITTPLIVRPASDTQAAVVVQDLSGDTIFVVDSRTNRVGVGTSSPDAKVHITSSSSVVPVLKANTSSVADILNLSKSDITVLSVSDTGETLIKQYTGNDSTTAFQVQNAAGTNQLVVDTVASAVQVSGLLDTTTATSLNVGTTNATAINLNKPTTIAANQNLTMTSGTGAFTQTATSVGTGNAHSITATGITSGSAFKVTATANTAANTNWSATSLNVTNAQATAAVTGMISGLDVQFTQNTAIAGNTETVANFAVAINNSSSTDSTIASILNLSNNDTATGNQIIVTDALKITGGSNITNGINLSGTFSGNLISSTNFNVTQAGQITAGGSVLSSTFDRSTAGALTIGASTATSIQIGAASNNMTFASTGEPTLNGTARHTRSVKLTPEYVGASMTADGSNNNGAMTSDNMTSSPYRNFYKWLNTQGTAQDYDIWVRYPLPSDWAAFPSGQTICLDTYASATTANGVTFTLYKMDDSTGSNLATILTSNDLTPTSTTTWQNRCTSSISGGSYVANGYLVMAIKMTAPATTGDIRIGDITFDYLSKW